MSKHTSGPWEVDPSPYRSAGGGLCVMHGNECVALVGGYNPEQPIRDNARLIAAAPELLYALQVAITSMLDAGHSPKSATMKLAKAAIDKATA